MKNNIGISSQVIDALQERNKGSRITSSEVIISGFDMNDMEKPNPRKYYFGSITAGDDTYIELYDNENKIITIDSGSQIVLSFTHIKPVDQNGDHKIVEGQFRGSIIQVLT